MHLIIDIRRTSVHDTLESIIAYRFGELWSTYKKDDTISYLISAGDVPKRENTIIADETFFPFFRKKLALKSGNQVFRCLNFSPFTPYDPTIRTYSHITDNRTFLYPSSQESTFWSRKKHEWERLSLIRESSKILVPHIKTGQELVELFGTREEKIEILPYLPLTFLRNEEHSSEKKYFLYDGKYGNEANIVGLLSAWSKYKHTFGGTYDLILTGFAGEELSHITHMLRTFDIGASVSYTGTMREDALIDLYHGASGWIYIGAYWSGGARIELARSLGLPLLLSDIAVFGEYTGIKIHPNHLEDLAPKLLELERYTPAAKEIHEENFIRAYERVLIV